MLFVDLRLNIKEILTLNTSVEPTPQILGIMDKRCERLLHKELECGAPIRPQDVPTFPTSFWILSLVCLAYYVAIFPFISLGQVFFIKKFQMDAKDANFVTGENARLSS